MTESPISPPPRAMETAREPWQMSAQEFHRWLAHTNGITGAAAIERLIAEARRAAMIDAAEIARTSGRRQFLAANRSIRDGPCVVSYGVIADDIERAAASPASTAKEE